MAGPAVQVVRASQRSAGPIGKLIDALADLFAGGRKRRLRRAVVGFERLASASVNNDPILARRYGRLVRLAARIDTHEAFRIVTAHDLASPDGTYGEAAALELEAFEVDDARTLVARGASIQTAILAGVIDDAQLLDVVPFSLGISAANSRSTSRVTPRSRHT
jgi:hypothetical protein